MGERAEEREEEVLCVGEPGRLSPGDSERLREDRLWLVCSKLDCLVIFLNRELRFLLQQIRKEGEKEEEEGEKEGGKNVSER